MFTKCTHVEKRLKLNVLLLLFSFFVSLVYHFGCLCITLTHLLGGRLNLLAFPYYSIVYHSVTVAEQKSSSSLRYQSKTFNFLFIYAFTIFVRFISISESVYYHSCENVSFYVNKSSNSLAFNLNMLVVINERIC